MDSNQRGGSNDRRNPTDGPASPLTNGADLRPLPAIAGWDHWDRVLPLKLSDRLRPERRQSLKEALDSMEGDRFAFEHESRRYAQACTSVTSLRNDVEKNKQQTISIEDRRYSVLDAQLARSSQETQARLEQAERQLGMRAERLVAATLQFGASLERAQEALESWRPRNTSAGNPGRTAPENQLRAELDAASHDMELVRDSIASSIRLTSPSRSQQTTQARATHSSARGAPSPELSVLDMPLVNLPRQPSPADLRSEWFNFESESDSEHDQGHASAAPQPQRRADSPRTTRIDGRENVRRAQAPLEPRQRQGGERGRSGRSTENRSAAPAPTPSGTRRGRG